MNLYPRFDVRFGDFEGFQIACTDSRNSKAVPPEKGAARQIGNDSLNSFVVDAQIIFIEN